MDKQQQNPVGRLWQLASKEHGRLLLSVVLAVIGVLGNMVPYISAARVIGGLLSGNKEMSFYILWCVIGFAGFAVKAVFYSIGLGNSHKAAFSIIAEIRKAMFAKLPKMPLGTIIDTSSGKLKQIIVDEVESMEKPLAHMIPELTANILGAVSIWIYLMTVDWRMGLITLISVPLGFFFMCLIMTTYAKDYEGSVKTVQEMNSTIVEYVHGIEVIKAYNQGTSSYTKFKDKVIATAQYYYDWMKKCQLNMSLTYTVTPCTLITVLPIGWLMYRSGSLDAETFVTSIMLSICIVGPIIAAVQFTDTSAKTGTIIATVDEILRGEEQQHATTPVDIKNHDIELKNVSYSYHEGTEILHNISLNIKEHTMTALVGPSGSGKSTIAKLIAGFWDVKDGEITLGGINLKDIPLEQLYDQVAFVSQDTYLFNDTVLNNIRMGRMSATDEEVKAAAEAAGCRQLIENLSNGYDTMVGQGGAHLSGGERQRIAIARAMIKDAPIIILDEATAYIDPENEAVIQDALGNLIKNKTVIVIAHRLSTITGADKIIVVEKGMVAAEGTHAELLENCGLYKTMWNAHVGAENGGAL